MLIALILFAVLAIAGIWTAFYFVTIPLFVPIVVTAFAVLLVIGFLVFRRLRAIARAAALERELLRQAGQQADQARPDRRADIVALQAQMKGAIEALKRTKLGARGGKTALYALPWYVIVGPPAAGKTTALEQSGLAFTAPGGTGKIKGTAGTKNCDWWFSKEAILLDTAGRFSTEEDDQEEWFSFLDTIKRFRPERPLDGVVVALSVVDLATATTTQIEELAAKLRARMEEVTTRLEMVVPIYVAFTKCDLVAGFVEFFGDFGKPQRAQVWGATFSLDDERLAEPGRAVEAEFDLLVRTLHARLVDRLPREPMPELRARILQFPVEFQALRAQLAHFVDELCRASPYHDAPILRGFYFTSGTQTGRPLDRVLSNMARGFNLRLAPPQDQKAAQPVSYFVTELFRNVMFPDRHLAVRSSSLVRRLAQRQVIYGAAALGLTMLIALPAAISYMDNVDLVQATTHDVAEAARLERVPGRPAAITDSLGVLVDRVRLLEQARSKVRVPGWWGARAAPDLLEPVQGLYVRKLRAAVEGPVREQVRADVRVIGDAVRSDAEGFQSSYDDLKLYVMLIAPEHLDPAWAAPKLSEKWARTLRAEQNLDMDKLDAHARYYVDALAADKTWAWPVDEAILSKARNKLARQPVEELQYASLIGHAKAVPAIRPEKFFYGSSVRFVTMRSNDVQVPGAYTAPGWETVRTALEAPTGRLVIEPWVIGGVTTNAADARETSAERLRELYFQRYERAWTDFLSGMTVQPPGDIRTAIEELETLSESDGPYTRLFRAVSENATLELDPSIAGKLLEKGKEAAGGAIDKATGRDSGLTERKISPVERRFRPLIRFAFGETGPGKENSPPSALNQYLVQINNLSVALRQLTESKAEPTAEFQAELERTAAAVTRLLAGFDAATRLMLEPYLMNPIRGSRAGVVSSGTSFLGDKWKAEVWETWNAKLSGRYPFAEVPEEVTVAEFGEFFRPSNGTLWKFYDKNLADRFERSGSTFTPKASADPIPFRTDFTRCLQVAQEITDAIFGSGGAEPSVPFSIKMQSVGPNVSEVTFRVDGQVSVYRNEPERWLATQWPGKATPRGAALLVKGAGFNDEIPRAGDFGLFRLLVTGGIKSAGEGILSASWNLNRAGIPPVTIQFKPAKSAHPFGRDFFRRLKCPAEVAAASGARHP